MAAYFKKPDWWAEPDGWDPYSNYQMLPSTRPRAMSIVTDAHDWVVIVTPRSTLKMIDVVPGLVSLGMRDDREVFKLPRNTTIQFSLLCDTVGRCSLALQRASGDTADASFLRVNVKSVRPVRYKAYILVDLLGRRIRRSEELIKQEIGLANRQLFGDANVQAWAQGELVDLPIDKDYPEVPVNTDEGWAEELKFWRKTLPPSAVDYYLIFVWKIRYNTIKEDPVGICWDNKYIFVEHHDMYPMEQTIVHEIGHALQLGHNPNADSVMDPYAQRSIKRFREDEINRLNNSA